jgi:hypothetical protein
MTESKDNNSIEVSVEAIPILTILGKIQYRYKLSDFAYGEWLIFENDKPKYYLNPFDEDYDDVRERIENSKDFDLEKILKMSNKNLSIHQRIMGVSFWYKSSTQVLALEKLPKSILDKTLKIN